MEQGSPPHARPPRPASPAGAQSVGTLRRRRRLALSGRELNPDLRTGRSAFANPLPRHKPVAGILIKLRSRKSFKSLQTSTTVTPQVGLAPASSRPTQKCVVVVAALIGGLLAVAALAAGFTLGNMHHDTAPNGKLLQCANPDLAVTVPFTQHVNGSSNSSDNDGDGDGGPVLIDRHSGKPVEVASIETEVTADGRLVSRSTGLAVRTAPADTQLVEHSGIEGGLLLTDRESGRPVQVEAAHAVMPLPEGLLSMLAYSASELQSVTQVTLWPANNTDHDHEIEMYQIVGVKRMRGALQLERAIALRTAGGEHIYIVQSANGTRSAVVLEAGGRAALEAELANEAGEILPRASLLARVFFAEEYLDHAGTEARGRRLELRRRLWLWSAATNLVSAVGSAVSSAVSTVASVAGSVLRSIVNGFTVAYDTVRGFIGSILNMIGNWMGQVKAWINDQIQRLSGGDSTSTLGQFDSMFGTSLSSMLLPPQELEAFLRSLEGAPWTARIGTSSSKCMGASVANSELFKKSVLSHDDTASSGDSMSWSAGFDVSVTLTQATMAMCMAFEALTLDMSAVGGYLSCLANKVVSFIGDLFATARDAIASVITKLAGWIANGIVRPENLTHSNRSASRVYIVSHFASSDKCHRQGQSVLQSYLLFLRRLRPAPAADIHLSRVQFVNHPWRRRSHACVAGHEC